MRTIKNFDSGLRASNYLRQTEGDVNVFPEAHLMWTTRRIVDVIRQNLNNIYLGIISSHYMSGLRAFSATLSSTAPAPPLLNTFCFGGKKRRPIYRPSPAAAAAWISAEPARVPQSEWTQVPIAHKSYRTEVSPKVLHHEPHIVSTQQKEVVFSSIMLANVLPDGSRLLPHVVITLLT